MINELMLMLDSGSLPEVDSQEIRDTARAVEKFCVLASAAELGIFDKLKEPMSSQELAEECGFHSGLTGKLCDALVASGFLTRNDGFYVSSPTAKRFLTAKSPFYQGNLIKLLKKTRETRWSRLSEAVRLGPVGFSMGDSVFDNSFIFAMAENAVCGTLQKTLEILRDDPDFLKARKCLDLGGGHGLYSIGFIGINPNLEAFVFDLPQVVGGVTEEAVSSYNDRIKTISGDLTNDELGDDYDFIFVSDVLYRSEEELRTILTKIHSSLKDRGLLISKHYHIDDPVADSDAVYFDLMFSISDCAERICSTERFSQLLKSCGFSIVRVENICVSSNPSKIIIARKVKE
jgi:hypothetical protein